MIKALIIIMALIPNIAAAGLYRCKDATGRSTYSDVPCATGNMAVTKPSNTQAKSAQSPSNEPLKKASDTKDSYTKDMPALESADAASKSCFKHANTTQHYPDPSSSKLLASRKKWVSVKDVGARQIVTIEVTSKNIGGMYVGKQSYDCLLMGDGQTVNTKPYELL